MVELHPRAPTQRDLDETGHLLLVCAPGDAGWPQVPQREALQRRLPSSAPALAQLPDAGGTWVTSLTVHPTDDTFTLLEKARKAVAPHLERKAPGLCVAFAALDHGLAAAVDAVISAFLVGAHALPRFTRTPPAERPTPRLALFIPPQAPATLQTAVQWAQATAEGTNLARDLVALPSNELTPGAFRERVEHLARVEGWDMVFYDRYRLRDLGAGAFLAVIRGGAEESGLVRLRYRSDDERAPLALVGKGVCFDTGGVNLKSARHMFGMHADMAGAASALGVLLALTRLHWEAPVECWLALADNLIGPEAYRPNEVVQAVDGTTIEIVHTDAEGRLLLADTLALVARRRPRLMVDLATLTGACVQALGDRYCGAFANAPEVAETARRAGVESGERAWPFPMDPDYDEALESRVADVKQCTQDTTADHILAARFLQRFVPADIPWLHLDLAPAHRDEGLAHVPTGITGFGVRLVTRLIQSLATS